MRRIGLEGGRFPTFVVTHAGSAMFGLVAASGLFVSPLTAKPQPELNAERTSFANLATYLLQRELGMIYGEIQVYPTNQYTPAVHRLLQVSANIHGITRRFDPTQEAVPPSLFKPVFEKRGGAICIGGYEEITGDARHLLTPPRDLKNSADRAALQPRDNVYNIPWIVAARKGFPNFNELAVDHIFEISRALEIRRPAVRTPPNETNQMLFVSLNSAVGVEAWNSYRAAFDRPVTVITTNRLDLFLCLTNQPSGLGSVQTNRMVSGRSIEIPVWQGMGPHPIPSKDSFVAPIATNAVIVTNHVFRANGDLVELPGPHFDRSSSNTFPVSDITIAFTNYLQFAILDQSRGTILDYVHLATGDKAQLSDIIADPLGSTRYHGLWITNRLGGDDSNIQVPPWGVLYQIWASLGLYGTPGNTWRDYGYGQLPGQSADKAIDQFQSFMLGRRSDYPPYDYNGDLAMRVPFTPAKRIQFTKSWQANDPLLHYTEWEVADFLSGIGIQRRPISWTLQTLRTLCRLNERYEPWGGNPSSSAGSRRRYDLRFNDPLVFRSDDWEFPTGDPLTPSDLGRVHRGTPWQTLYCKAAELSLGSTNGLRVWSDWTGISPPDEAYRVRPAADWNPLSHLINHLWPEKPNKLLSVNETRRHRWLKALDGVEALTNTVPDETLASSPFRVLEYDVEVISWKSDQAEQIVNGIENYRSLEPEGWFEDVGEILGVEELSTKSPFLNLSTIQRERGITDEAYEAIPLQLLPRLRPDSVGKWMQKNGRQHLRFSGLDNCAYRIESSTDMVHWTPVQLERVKNGYLRLDIVPDSSEACRFYRSVLVEADPNCGPQSGSHANAPEREAHRSAAKPASLR